MQLFKNLFICMLIYLLISCSPYAVKIDYDKGVDFKNYKTFKWIKPKKDKIELSVFTNSLNQKRFAATIEKELTKKGLTRIEEGKPDLNVAFHVRMKKKLDVTSYGYSYWHRPGRVTGYTQYRTYQEGTFVVDIIDAQEKQLIWRGVAEGALKENDDVENLIKSVVKEVLKEYPPKE